MCGGFNKKGARNYQESSRVFHYMREADSKTSQEHPAVSNTSPTESEPSS